MERNFEKFAKKYNCKKDQNSKINERFSFTHPKDKWTRFVGLIG